MHSFATSWLVLVVYVLTGWGYSFTCVSYLDGFSEISEASVSTLAARKPDAPSIVAIAPGVDNQGRHFAKFNDYGLSVLADDLDGQTSHILEMRHGLQLSQLFFMAGDSELAIFLSLPSSISSRGFAPLTGLGRTSSNIQ